MKVWPALALDVICILVFAIVGRSSHGEASDVIGVARTAWPFLVGCLIGVLAGRTWRDASSMQAAVYVWASTVVLGMVLRFLSGGGVQISFVIVTATVLGVFFFGWRAGLKMIHSARRRPSKATPH